MLTDDDYFENMRKSEAPKLCNSLIEFVGMTLRNNYTDTFVSPVSPEIQRWLDELEAVPRAPLDPHES
ncbi:hypothetical protein [Microvirga pudoricolor]|uniref:hypothetical protein n=1 Tax=Microvirga pudoricolor TaxID=2778729 RepID=UPI00194F8198|nr:hypothetical protein [Microvirga pudoricolor]MBM6593726.1 hypothetical protein [Microvirga pudoricolor]